MSCWWIVTVCSETLMFTLTDLFEGQSCLFGWTSSGVWLPGLTSAFYQIEDFVSKLSPPFYKPHRAGRTEWSLATFILLNSGCSCLSTMATFTFGTTRASNSSSRLRWETIFGLHFPTCRCAIVIFSFPGLRSSSQSSGFCTKEELGRHWFWWYAGGYYLYVHILTKILTS